MFKILGLMMEDSKVAMLVSFASLLLSLFGFVFSIRQASNARKMERVKIYDKAYHDASDLLVFHYKKEMEVKFTCDDKVFERAVNAYGDAHWLEQYYGLGIEFPEDIVSEEQRLAYRNNVADTYRKYSEEKNAAAFNESLNYQSPVFHLEDDGFRFRFDRLMMNVTENLSFLVPQLFLTGNV